MDNVVSQNIECHDQGKRQVYWTYSVRQKLSYALSPAAEATEGQVARNKEESAEKPGCNPLQSQYGHAELQITVDKKEQDYRYGFQVS